jgi:hypothetical protein
LAARGGKLNLCDSWEEPVGDTKIIIKNLRQAEYSLLKKELDTQHITPISAEKTSGKFGEPVTVTVILAIGAVAGGTAIAVGIAGWLMKKTDKEEIIQDFDVEHEDGRIEHRRFRYKKRSDSATDPELLKALKDTLPNLSQAV